MQVERFDLQLVLLLEALAVHSGFRWVLAMSALVVLSRFPQVLVLPLAIQVVMFKFQLVLVLRLAAGAARAGVARAVPQIRSVRTT